jgi:hypothetical protein
MYDFGLLMKECQSLKIAWALTPEAQTRKASTHVPTRCRRQKKQLRHFWETTDAIKQLDVPVKLPRLLACLIYTYVTYREFQGCGFGMVHVQLIMYHVYYHIAWSHKDTISSCFGKHTSLTSHKHTAGGVLNLGSHSFLINSWAGELQTTICENVISIF